MKSIFIAAASAIAMFSPVPAMAEWIPIAPVKSGIIQIENSSVVRTNNTIVNYLQRYVRNTPDERGAIAYDTYVSRNCYSGEWVTNEIVGYNSKGDTVLNVSSRSPVQKTLAGTSAELVHNFTCYTSNAASRREFIYNIHKIRY